MSCPLDPSGLPGPLRRRRNLSALQSGVFDILVVGGGSVGTGIALHAAARGLLVALVELDDFGGGTSGRSTKLVHGGVRYLERAVLRADLAEYRLVLEALRERGAFFRLAPHLTRPLAILTPAYSLWRRLYYGAGLAIYDMVSGNASLGATRHLAAPAALDRFPALDSRGLRGAVLYYDGQFDDARFNVALALTASALGAVVVNHAAVIALIKEGARVIGAQVRDGLSGATLTVRARSVINATGPFADRLRALDEPAATPLLRPSGGIHLVLRPGLCPDHTGLLIPKTSDGRVVFVLPWLGHTLIGTTDRPEDPAEHPAVRTEDVDYLLQLVNRHVSTPLRREDVRSAWSGQRPLVRNPTRAHTAALSRSHIVVESAAGLVTVAGGKWTSYRRIAADAVEYVLRQQGLRARPAAAASERVLIGGDGFSENLVREVQQRRALPADVATHLGHAYGDRMEAVCTLAGQEWMQRLAPQHPYLEAEVVWAVREESALRVMDVLARRTRLAFLDRAVARSCVTRVAQLMGAELGWSAAHQRTEELEALAQLDGDM